jgi:hypothetical protein
MRTSVRASTVAVLGRRRSDRWVLGSLEEDASGTEVRELPEPMPVHAWFQLPNRLIRRSDAQAYRLTRDVVWVEAGRGETKLAA